MFVCLFVYVFASLRVWFVLRCAVLFLVCCSLRVCVLVCLFAGLRVRLRACVHVCLVVCLRG